MLKKTKINQKDYQHLMKSSLLDAFNTAGSVAVDIISAGNDEVTACWYSHIWWMLDLCQHYLELDSQEMENKLRGIWNGMRMPKNDGTDLPFPKLVLAERENPLAPGTYGRDFLTVYNHILSEREYFLNLVYEVENEEENL